MIYKRYVYIVTLKKQNSESKILKALPYRTRKDRIANIEYNGDVVIYQLKYYVESRNKEEFLKDLSEISKINKMSIEFNIDNITYLMLYLKENKGVTLLPKLKLNNEPQIYKIKEEKIDKFGIENLFNTLIKNEQYLKEFNTGYYYDFNEIEDQNLRIKMSLVKFLKKFYREEMNNEEKEQVYYFYKFNGKELKNNYIIKDYNEEQFNYYIKKYLYGNNYNDFCLNIRPIILEVLSDCIKYYYFN